MQPVEMQTHGLAAQRLENTIQRRHREIIQLRRYLHMHPELSGQEFATTEYLASLLEQEGLEPKVGPDRRGLVVDLHCGDKGELPLLALRADMDAIPVQDAKQVEYRSRHEGVMHACGHDAHTAMLFGALVALNELAGDGEAGVPFRIRAIFQPAEETATGAREMVQWGVLQDVKNILALHVDSSRPVGTIGLRSGIVTANCDEICVEVRGTGGHAARPHETRDPILAAVRYVDSVYATLPRIIDSRNPLVVTFSQFHGGSGSNVIPDHVILRGTMRSIDRDARLEAQRALRHIAASTGQMLGTQFHVDFGVYCPAVENHSAVVEWIRESVQPMLKPGAVQFIPQPSMGGEDFAVYLDHVPGALLRLGCASGAVGDSPLHSSTFDVDDLALEIGARILTRCVLHWARMPDSQWPGAAVT